MTPPTRQYALVTAARNEAEHLGETVRSVTGQELKPGRWVIVDDGSTDDTDQLIRDAAARVPFIDPVRLAGGRARDFASKAHALHEGLARIHPADFEFIGVLDADIALDPDYFRRLMDWMDRHPDVGLGGGVVCEPAGNAYAPRPTNAGHSVAGAVHFFRRECFEQIEGYHPLPCGGEDWVAETMVKLRGWQVQSFDKLQVRHLRPDAGAGMGQLKRRFREGRMDYALGSHPLFEGFKCARRLWQSPRVVGALVRYAGYCAACVRRDPRDVPTEVIEFIRNEQRQRLRRIVPGWRRFTAR